jgi:inner membrane protein involved in colicin E2 resistance
VARSNGQPGHGGTAIALVGLGVLLFGVFAGAELRGLNTVGFVLVLAGALTILFGVLREATDRFRR